MVEVPMFPSPFLDLRSDIWPGVMGGANPCCGDEPALPSSVFSMFIIKYEAMPKLGLAARITVIKQRRQVLTLRWSQTWGHIAVDTYKLLKW